MRARVDRQVGDGGSRRRRSELSLGWRCRLRCALALAGLCLLQPASATAVIAPPSILDGPTNDILGVGGSAMARDGTGGILYRRSVDGVAHLFVVPFANGAWGTPTEVDPEDHYGASEPAIAAGEGGRLLVVWVQPRNVDSQGVTVYALMSASMQPGARSFGQAVAVDEDVSEPYTGDISGVEPALAMAPSGEAYVVYRAIVNDCGTTSAGEPHVSACVEGSGDKLVQVRVARFDYLTWSPVGVVNRDPQIAMRDPTAANAPSIGIDLSGNGVVAWQEPGIEGVARIWVRRLFGTVLGNVLEASPETIAGHPVSSDAEAPVVADSPYGEARIAFRIRGEPGTVVPTTELYLNSLSSALRLEAALLKGAVPVAGAVSNSLGQPSAGVDARGDFRVTWMQGVSVQDLEGDLDTIDSPHSIGQAGEAANAATPTSIDPAGGGTTVWTDAQDGAPAVAVRQEYPHGGFQLAQLAGSIPGAPSGLALAGSGEGDALLAWTVGQPGDSEILGDFVQAPPAPFEVISSFKWVRSGAATVSWQAPADAVAGIEYALFIDGKERLSGLTGLSVGLGVLRLGDGVHHVQVLATDSAGQETMSEEGEILVDASPPIVRLKLVDQGRAVRVTVSDHASGVDTSGTLIAFGDGTESRGRSHVLHTYRQAGTYTITAHVRDNVGNSAVVHLRVRVR